MLSFASPEFTAALVGLTFLEGLLSFLSPCILPLLPVYLMYLSGSRDEESRHGRLILNTLGFIAGFTVVFVLLGATASGLGHLLGQHRNLLQRIGGVIMILFGLNFLGVLNFSFLNATKKLDARPDNLKFFSSALFGGVFSLGWTPCLGPFIGSALIMASASGTLLKGIILLLSFSLGLGVPFLLTALLWGRMQGAFSFVKRHLGKIKAVSGILLILVGLLMALDFIGYYMGLFS